MDNKVNILPITHESNRLGELVLEHELGKVYSYENRFYAWPNDNRGFRFNSLFLAAKHLGIKKPTGCEDYHGKVRLGRMIERGPNGEIYKAVMPATVSYMDHVDYYFWPKEGEAVYCLNFSEARKMAGIEADLSTKRPAETPPKSSYPQNQKGYDPHSHKAK